MTGRRRRDTAAADADALREIDAIYASLPTIECRGECWDSCGSIAMTSVEQRRIATRHGRILPLQASFDGLCPALTMLGRCSVYADRPLVCRLFGLVPSMRCNFGCVPDGGLMTERDGYLTIARVAELSGDHTLAAEIRSQWEDPAVAVETEKRLKAWHRQRDDALTLHHALAERDGSAIYLTPGGRLSRTRTKQVGGPIPPR